MPDMKDIPGTTSWISAGSKGSTTTATKEVVVKEEGKTNPIKIENEDK